jgi:hypothetical protein
MAVTDVALSLLTSQFHDRSSLLTLVSVRPPTFLLDLMAVFVGVIISTRHIREGIDGSKMTSCRRLD